jgi:hypothetical protein
MSHKARERLGNNAECDECASGRPTLERSDEYVIAELPYGHSPMKRPRNLVGRLKVASDPPRADQALGASLLKARRHIIGPHGARSRVMQEK